MIKGNFNKPDSAASTKYTIRSSCRRAAIQKKPMKYSAAYLSWQDLIRCVGTADRLKHRAAPIIVCRCICFGQN
jgi:hypothetical protein